MSAPTNVYQTENHIDVYRARRDEQNIGACKTVEYVWRRVVMREVLR